MDSGSRSVTALSENETGERQKGCGGSWAGFVNRPCLNFASLLLMESTQQAEDRIKQEWLTAFLENSGLKERQDVVRTATLLAQRQISIRTVKGMSGSWVYQILQQLIEQQLDGDDIGKAVGWGLLPAGVLERAI